jgi:energy-coupling factor transport system permease protein
MTATDPHGLLAYVPGHSWLHRASPLPKLAWLAGAVVMVLATYEPAVLAAIAALGFLLALSAGVGRAAVRTMIALAPVAASVIVLQALAPVACRPACTPVASIGPLTLYAEGLSHALALVARLLAMETVGVAMLATTHPSDLFAVLRRLRLPYEISLMAMLSLQLIPQLLEELRTVLQAQRSRGLRATGIGALVPTLIPVVAGSFDRLTTLVLSLEARGLGAGPRTSYRRVDLRRVDLVATAVALPVTIAGTAVALTRWGAGQASTVVLPPEVAVAIVVGAGVVFVVVMTSGLRALARG